MVIDTRAVQLIIERRDGSPRCVSSAGIEPQIQVSCCAAEFHVEQTDDGKIIVCVCDEILGVVVEY